MALGFIRVVTLGAAFFGAFWVLPQTILNPETTNFYAPFVAVMVMSPILVTGLFFGGFVFHMNIIIPTAARRGREELLKWAERVPADTEVVLKALWFRPWPHNTRVRFGDLRRLKNSFVRMSNLECVPKGLKEKMELEPRRGWWTKMSTHRYLLNKTFRDRGQVRGVMDLVWKQIPFAGEEEVEAAVKEGKPPDLPKKVERKEVLGANRQAVEQLSSPKVSTKQILKTRPKR